MLARPVRIVQPYPFTHRFLVKPADDGSTILSLFCVRFPFKTQVEWASRILSGHIRINDQIVPPSKSVKIGDVITHYTQLVIEPSVPDEVRVLQDNVNWIAVYKPAPLPMHSGGRYHKNTLQYIVEEKRHHPVFVTHRLDAVTSGIIVLAKNEQTARNITEAFAQKEVKKEYKALVAGTTPHKKWTVDKPIRRKEGFLFECCEPNEGGKSAITHFEVEQYDENRGLSTITCLPLTGRTHQIRLHLRESNVPIVDDSVYLNKETVGKPAMQNRAIHLFHNRLEIPMLNIYVQCALPEWWGEIG